MWHGCRLSADGGLVAVQSLREDGPNVQVWSTTGGELVMEATQRPAWVGAARFSPRRRPHSDGGR